MKRALLLIALAALLIAFVFPSIASGDASASQAGVVTAGSFAWVRSGPGTQYGTVAKLSNGAPVTILESVAGQAYSRGNPTWYRIGDGRYVYSGLVRAVVPATPPPTQPGPPPIPQPNGGKWIEVILSEYKLIAWEGNTAVLTTIVAIGKPQTPTVTGTFHIYSKYEYKDLSGPGYYHRRVPHIMFFYQGYAIHGAYWHSDWGTAISHGCVNVNLTDAGWLYDWAPSGTKVVIHNLPRLPISAQAASAMDTCVRCVF